MSGTASLGFGLQGDFIVGFEKSPVLFYYKHQTENFEVIWNKTVAKNLTYNCLKYASPSGEIFLQRYTIKVCLHDQQLSLIRKLHAPGTMIGLLHGGRYAVVNNEASPGVLVKLSVVPALDLGSVHHHLDVPPEGECDRGDELHACGHEESGVAVVVLEKPFVDLYNPEGELYTIYTSIYGMMYSNNNDG